MRVSFKCTFLSQLVSVKGARNANYKLGSLTGLLSPDNDDANCFTSLNQK